MKLLRIISSLAVVPASLLLVVASVAQEAAPATNGESQPAAPIAETPAAETPATEQPVAERAAADTPAAEADGEQSSKAGKLTRISKQDKVWIDPQRKLVVVEGEIVLTNGQLELFACPKGTKEHESVVAVDSRAFVVHTALLAIGARSGSPVQFTPVFQVPTGDIIEVLVLWVDEDGKKHQRRAQEMVRNIKTEKPMQHNWVFGGSGFWVDETTNERRYLGESGELISVSNFPTATIDVQVRSSEGNDNLLFEAFTENIPPRGTKVRLVLIPRKSKAAKENPPAAETPAEPAEAEAVEN